MTLQEKWDDLLTVAKRRADAFIKAVYPNPAPTFWVIEGPWGMLNECTPKELYYQWPFRTYLTGKKPTKKDIEHLTAALEKPHEMNADNISVAYSWNWDGKRQASSALKASDVFGGNKDGHRSVFLDKAEAEQEFKKRQAQKKADQEFDETHKKDKSYDYVGNGYKFLGWQNGWKHVHFDSEGNVTDDPKKAVTFGYLKEDYPEYGACREQKHRTIDVSHNQWGSEHTVSCPVCKLYWKYDSSD